MKAHLICALAWAVSGAGSVRPVQAATQVEQRTRIEGERSAALARFDAQQRDCMTRFAVNACLDEARSERRTVLDRLRQEEFGLDQLDREGRAARRLEQARQREAEAQAEQATEALRPPRAAAGAASRPIDEAVEPEAAVSPWPEPTSIGHAGAAPALATRPTAAEPPSKRAPRATSPASAAESASQRREQETRSEAAYRRRQLEARAHAEQVRARSAEAARQGKPVAPLPLPPAASSP